MRSRFKLRAPPLQALAVAAVVSALALVGLSCWLIAEARQSARQNAEQGAGNIVLSLERDIARNIEIYDLSLKSAVSGLALPDLAALSPEARQAALFDTAASAADFGAIGVLDAAGNLLFQSGPAQPRPANLAEKDWFIYLRDHPDTGLHLSLTTRSYATHKQSLILSRRINGPDGTFAGAVVGAIHLEYFNRLFSGLALGGGDVIVLVTGEGRIVTRRPYQERDIGRDISRAEVVSRVKDAPSGSFENDSIVDGVRRIYSYRRVGELPLVVQVGLATRTVFADWLHKALINGAVLGAFVAMTVLLAVALRRELRRRALLQTQLRDSEAGFRLLAENASDMVSRVGADGRLVYVSPASFNLIGVSGDDLAGRRLLDYVYEEDRETVASLEAQLRAGSRAESATFRMRHPARGEVWVEASARSLRDPVTDAIEGHVAVTRDVTERVGHEAERARHEHELERSNAQLERMARHLARARDESERANHAKTHFLAGMSHELRTPLNGILGYAQLLQLEGGLTSTQSSRVEAMLEAGQHLLEMINRVLDFSAVEAGRCPINLAEVDPAQIAASCLEFVRPAAEAKGLALRIEVGANTPALLATDPIRLRQITLNLLGNAVKFTERGSIELRLGAARNGALLRMEVADTGTGISEPERLFQDFERLGTDAAAVEGAGLGLALSARLATLLGGRLGYAENPAGGSVFWLELELHRQEPSAQAQRSATQANAGRAVLRSLRVLVVDDVAMNREIASSFLRAAGHEVSCAQSGIEAVSRAADDDFDVVLMDVRMPGIDGLEATRRIRSLPSARAGVPIVALTAQAFAEQVAECRAAGMNAHLAKPFVQSALLACVASAADRGRQQTNTAAPKARRASQHTAWGDLPILNAAVFARTADFLSADEVFKYMHSLGERGAALLESLRQAGPRNANHDLAASAHMLAGSSGMFGFERLAAACRSLEATVKDGVMGPATLVDDLVAIIEASIHVMRTSAKVPVTVS